MNAVLQQIPDEVGMTHEEFLASQGLMPVLATPAARVEEARKLRKIIRGIRSWLDLFERHLPADEA